MMLRLIIGIYVIGCICSILDMANDLNEQSKVGYFFSIIYIMSRKESYKYILQSWYFIHRP